jgi:hypothetical protein
MKKLLHIALIALFFVSCSKKYDYTEIRSDGDKEVVIEAKNDSVAYLEAYKKFCISLAAEAMTRKAYSGYSSISGFKLFDKKGKIVKAPFTVESKIQHEKDIEERVFGPLGIDDIALKKLYRFKTLELQLEN